VPARLRLRSGLTITREVRLPAGAEFIVVICSDIMTMPGLPKVPSAEVIDLDEKGQITGLF
jgi:formate--tetrahydrofolate ligase